MDTTTTRTVGELAVYLEEYYEQHEQNPPARVNFDKVAAALGVGRECTGNPDTATGSVEHTPKAGLSVRFYSVNPAHRNERYILDSYYVATWRGAEYRGHICLSDTAYHADNVNGFTCWDRSSYSTPLPDGARRMVADIVTQAVKGSGVSLEELKNEKIESNIFYAVSSQLYAARMAVDGAARITPDNVARY
jgi:hypothetical protein